MDDLDRRDNPDTDRPIYAGLIALAQITIFQLTDKPLTTPGKWAVGLFAASMPLLAACVLSSIARGRESPPRPQSRLGALVGAAGALLAVAGFAAFFANLGVYYIAAFAVTAVIAIGLLRRM